jgi:hypothetical protein
VACVVGAVQDVRVVRGKVSPVVASCGVEHGCRTGVLPRVEERRAEEMT